MKKTILFILTIICFISCSSNDNEISSPETESEACTQIKTSVSTLKASYISSPQSSLETNCRNYLNALKDQKTICGDDDGSIQKIIESLKDCTNNN